MYGNRLIFRMITGHYRLTYASRLTQWLAEFTQSGLIIRLCGSQSGWLCLVSCIVVNIISIVLEQTCSWSVPLRFNVDPSVLNLESRTCCANIGLAPGAGWAGDTCGSRAVQQLRTMISKPAFVYTSWPVLQLVVVTSFHCTKINQFVTLTLIFWESGDGATKGTARFNY